MGRAKEVYPNAPLEFVAFEVRFPTIRRALSDEGLDELQKVLGERFPIFDPVTEKQLQVGPSGPGDLKATRWFRFLSTSRSRSVSLQAKRLVVETTQYEQYEDFREAVALALEALEKADRVPVFERIGLRYIDEIRAPVKTGNPDEWGKFINEALLEGSTVAPSGSKQSRLEGVIRFELEPCHSVVLRYGNHEGEIIGEGLLRLKPNKVRSGSFFLIDIDSFLEGLTEGDEFSSKAALKICDKLREPVREIFEKTITDRLRKEVLRKEPAHVAR